MNTPANAQIKTTAHRGKILAKHRHFFPFFPFQKLKLHSDFFFFFCFQSDDDDDEDDDPFVVRCIRSRSK
jgi:hypothetical protein